MLLGAYVPTCDVVIIEGPSYLINTSLFSCHVCCALVQEALLNSNNVTSSGEMIHSSLRHADSR